MFCPPHFVCPPQEREKQAAKDAEEEDNRRRASAEAAAGVQIGGGESVDGTGSMRGKMGIAQISQVWMKITGTIILSGTTIFDASDHPDLIF